MPSFAAAHFALFASLLWILLQTTTAIPGISCDSLNHLDSSASKECARALPQTARTENTPASVLLNSTCPYPERYRYRLPRSAKSIEFSSWGAEFPIFDDVADMLDKAENDLTEDIKAQGWDRPIRRIRTWTFESARLVVRNDEGGNGVNHRDLITFLRGLGDFGMVHGFWACKMVFWDTYYSVDRRGVAEISVHAGPRDGVATA